MHYLKIRRTDYLTQKKMFRISVKETLGIIQAKYNPFQKKLR